MQQCDTLFVDDAEDNSRLCSLVTSENMLGLMQVPRQYRAVTDPILAFAGLSYFQHSRVNMSPVKVSGVQRLKLAENGAF